MMIVPSTKKMNALKRVVNNVKKLKVNIDNAKRKQLSSQRSF